MGPAGLPQALDVVLTETQEVTASCLVPSSSAFPLAYELTL